MKCKEKTGILQANNLFPDTTTNHLDFSISTHLNRKIAENCLTKITTDSIPSRIEEAHKSNTLAQLSIYNNGFASIYAC